MLRALFGAGRGRGVLRTLSSQKVKSTSGHNCVKGSGTRPTTLGDSTRTLPIRAHRLLLIPDIDITPLFPSSSLPPSPPSTESNSRPKHAAPLQSQPSPQQRPRSPHGGARLPRERQQEHRLSDRKPPLPSPPSPRVGSPENKIFCMSRSQALSVRAIWLFNPCACKHRWLPLQLPSIRGPTSRSSGRQYQ